MSLRQLNRERVRQELLDAAERLFRDRGFDATLIEDITGAAQVSRQTFFNYFETKDRVLYELGMRWLAQQIEGTGAPESKRAEVGGSPLQAIRRGLRQQAQAVEADREFMALVYTRSGVMLSTSKPTPDNEARLSVSRRGFEAWAELVRQAQQAGEMRRNVDPLQVAELIFALQAVTTRLWLTNFWSGGVQRRGSKNLSERLHTRVLRAFDMLVNGLRNE